MAHMQYMPGDHRLVDQLVCELKSKGIFDQFRKECIADVDTRPAYQNLRQRVETSVATFLSRQVWKPDLNKNQLREKLRKHLLEGNYLEQGVERIVDQVVNPKVASVFIPQVEDLVYNYLGIPRKKAADPETSNGKPEDLLPTDLEAVSPGSVKSNDEKDMDTTESKDEKMDVDDKPKPDIKDDSMTFESFDKEKDDTRLSGISELTIHDSDSVSIDKNTITIPLPAEIKLENIPAPENSPPNIKDKNIDLEKIDLPKEPNLSTDIPLPDEIPKVETESYFKPIALQSEDDDDSSDSSIKRNMSPLTPIRNFNNENSCDAQQAFENDSDSKTDDKKEPSTFRFTIESKSSENSSDAIKPEKKEEPINYQFNTPTINSFNTPMYDDSSNSNNLQIDYESDANSKIVDAKAPEPDQNSVDSHKKDKKDDKKSSHKSSHRSRDSSRHSSSKDKRSDSKHSSRDSSRHDKKSVSSKDDKSKSSEKKNEKEKSSDKSDRGDKKDSRESSKHRSSSHKDSKSSSSHRDSKHKSSSTSSGKHSSKDEKKSSSSSSRDKEKEKSSTKSKDSRDKSKDYKSSSRDKDKKSSSSSSKRSDDKENKEKKEKKEADDHYSLSGRGNPNRRSTDRDSNDGSTSSKGSHNPASKTADSKKESKPSSKSGSTSSSDSTSPSDGVEVTTAKGVSQTKPIVRVDTRLENPILSPPRLPFVPDVTLKKPKFAANMQEARQLMKMRKFMEEEQKRMNQEAALLLEFQANVRPSLSQVYSSIPGPELEFACMPNGQPNTQVVVLEEPVKNDLENHLEAKETEHADTEFSHLPVAKIEEDKHDDEIAKTLIAMHEDVNAETTDDTNEVVEAKVEHTDASVLEDLTDQENDLTIVEEISESSEDKIEIVVKTDDDNDAGEINDNANDLKEIKTESEAVQPIELIEIEDLQSPTKKESPVFMHSEETPLHYFCENEKYDAEIERNKFNIFYKKYTEHLTSKMYLVNCDTYEENIVREVAQSLGKIEIVNYYKNGHLKLPKTTKNIVKNVNVSTEINLPANTRPVTPEFSSKSPPIFSPTKSECSFELSSDYDAKLEEMVNKTSRQEIMEIILGGAIDESPCEMPRIDYCMESNIEDNTLKWKHEIECTESNIEENTLKRKHNEIECSVNNNRPVLTPNKLRKMSGSDQISSTTEETEETPNNKTQLTAPRSKFLGKARRVGLPKPKKSNIQNSPSSDKSVENYQQNSTHSTPNGKIKNTPRSKVQRYDTSDLYKPKLHYLSRRNNIS